MIETREELSRRAVDLGLAHLAEPLAQQVTPCLRLRTSPLLEGIPIGASRFGGQPDGDGSFAWPRVKGRPLPFICQVSVPDVVRSFAGSPLQGGGFLLFFSDMDSGVVVLVDSPKETLRAIAPPPDLVVLRPSMIARMLRGARNRPTFPVCSISFLPGLSLPTGDEPEWMSLQVNDEDELALEKLLEELGQSEQVGMAHQMFGRPHAIQGGCFERLCEYESRGLASSSMPIGSPEVEVAAKEWRLLLQVDSDDNAEFMWGDAGRLYFLARVGDLEARRFEMVRVFFECY